MAHTTLDGAATYREPAGIPVVEKPEPNTIALLRNVAKEGQRREFMLQSARNENNCYVQLKSWVPVRRLA
jgi:hypothetical protein